MVIHTAKTEAIITKLTPNANPDTSLLRLLQLSSASLPVGGYSFSQGVEYAIDEGWVKNEADVADWVSLLMQESLAQVDLPLLQRLMRAQQNNDLEKLTYWNAYALACRETHELKLTDTAMGDALVRLLTSLDIPFGLINKTVAGKKDISFLSAFAAAAVHWQIDEQQACVGFLWSWLENQIAAATKIVPLGQTSAQKLLVQLGEEITPTLEQANNIHDDSIGSSLPGMAMASSWHETQYSRLFRS
jgi:urease accessory protein